MTNDENFQKYKKIKKEISFSYKGYTIEKIVALDLIVEIYIKRNETLRTIISSAIKSHIPTYFSSLNFNNLKIDEPSKILFSMGVNSRKDYYEILNFAKSHVNSPVTFDFAKQKKKLKINFTNVIRSWKILSKTKELNFLTKFKLASKITYYLNLIDDLEKIGPVVKKYCAFNSILDHEALLTNYFKNKGIPTYSLQHAVYPVYKKQVPLPAILYENFNPDFLLCWGQYTINEFAEYGINRNSLIIAGYPREIERPLLPVELDKKNCIVLLGGSSNHKANLKLLKILEKFNSKYPVNVRLKLHPSLFQQNYWNEYKDTAGNNDWHVIPENITISNLFNEKKFGWSISVNSSAYYESYLHYIPCLRYNDGSYEDFLDITTDTFKNTIELEKRYTNIPFDDPESLRLYFKNADKELEYAMGVNTNRYDILNK